MSLSQQLLAATLDLGLAVLGRLRRPRLRGTWHLPGLIAAVEILRDRWGVPHIYAAGAADLMFAQGFVHAQDRLWQMEFQRRLVAGRLAELVGPAALSVDRAVRILGMRRVAEAEVALLDAKTRAALDAYVAGVNACMAREPLPVEFRLLRYRPEPWTAADSLSWTKMLAWSLSVNWESELLRAALRERLGPQVAAELEPAPPATWPVVLENGGIEALAGFFDGPAQPADHEGGWRTASLPAEGLDSYHAGSADLPAAASTPGSNNWVVAGWRSATGMPLLANDMHLLLTTPAIWYENHLVCDEVNVTGVTFPGIPGVVAGHNGHVAWGFTNGFPDVQDLYMERLRRTHDGRVQYLFRGEWLDAEVRQEVIRVKGGQPVVQEVIVTRHGPIINALAPGLAAPVAIPAHAHADTGSDPSPLAHPLALRWTALDPAPMLATLRTMNRARNVAEFREALRGWVTPVQNTVYADTQGDIGYSYPGRVPIRAHGQGRVPVPGWDGEHEWVGYVPFDELPHLLNPSQGFIASANNRVADARYPHFLGSEFANGDRAERIVALLRSRPLADVPFFQQMQQEQVSPTMQAIAGYLAQLQPAEVELAAAVEAVHGWDGRLTADSPAAAICEVFSRVLAQILLMHRLGGSEADRDLITRYLGKGPTPVLAEASFMAHRAWEWLLQILAQPHAAWFDLGNGERRDEAMLHALRQTMAYLEERLGPPGPGLRNWAWGRLHTLTFGHLVGRMSALARYFNRGPFPLGGDSNTVWATGNGLTPEASTAVVGPPFRFIADLADLDHCWGCLVPGNSGRPDSPHYDDQIAAWFKGEYHPMLYARADVERGTVARLKLAP